jgi:hypothetical protein
MYSPAWKQRGAGLIVFTRLPVFHFPFLRISLLLAGRPQVAGEGNKRRGKLSAAIRPLHQPFKDLQIGLELGILLNRFGGGPE